MTASTSCGPPTSRMSLPPPTSSPQNSTRMSVMSPDLCRQGMSTSQLSPDLCHLPMSSTSGMSPESCRQNLMSNRPPSTSLLQVAILSTLLLPNSGMGKVRLAGQIRHAKAFCQARDVVFSTKCFFFSFHVLSRH